MTIQELITKYENQKEKLQGILSDKLGDGEYISIYSKIDVYEDIITDLKSLSDELNDLTTKYNRLKQAASKSVGDAHITNTRLKRVISDDK